MLLDRVPYVCAKVRSVASPENLILKVEDVADALERGSQNVQGHLVQPGRVDLLGQAETFLHGG